MAQPLPEIQVAGATPPVNGLVENHPLGQTENKAGSAAHERLGSTGSGTGAPGESSSHSQNGGGADENGGGGESSRKEHHHHRHKRKASRRRHSRDESGEDGHHKRRASRREHRDRDKDKNHHSDSPAKSSGGAQLVPHERSRSPSRESNNERDLSRRTSLRSNDSNRRSSVKGGLLTSTPDGQIDLLASQSYSNAGTKEDKSALLLRNRRDNDGVKKPGIEIIFAIFFIFAGIILAIVGGVVQSKFALGAGCVVIAVGILFVVLGFCLRKRKPSKEGDEEEGEDDDAPGRRL